MSGIVGEEVLAGVVVTNPLHKAPESRTSQRLPDTALVGTCGIRQNRDQLDRLMCSLKNRLPPIEHEPDQGDSRQSESGGVPPLG